MFFAGIDVGAQSIKAVIFDGEKVIGSKLIVTEEGAEAAARKVYRDLLSEIGCETREVKKVFATGSGSREISFADKRTSEQVCAARGARWLCPTARTVFDMGVEGCRAMKLGQGGGFGGLCKQCQMRSRDWCLY